MKNINIHNGLKTQLLCYLNNHIIGKNKVNPRPDIAVWESRSRHPMRSSGNKLKYGLSDCRRCIFDFRGENNCVEIEDATVMRNIEIVIVGNKNYIHIGKACGIYNVTITLFGENDRISIGDNCHFFCNDDRGIVMGGHGSDVIIEEDCLFAPGAVVRSHDAHSIINISHDRSLNVGKSVIIGKHVWLATRATVLKGSEVGAGSVVGTNTLISNKKIPNNCLVVGNPCRIVKEEITWQI